MKQVQEKGDNKYSLLIMYLPPCHLNGMMPSKNLMSHSQVANLCTDSAGNREDLVLATKYTAPMPPLKTRNSNGMARCSLAPPMFLSLAQLESARMFTVFDGAE